MTNENLKELADEVNRQGAKVVADKYCKKPNGEYFCPKCGAFASIAIDPSTQHEELICNADKSHHFHNVGLVLLCESLYPNVAAAVEMARNIYGLNEKKPPFRQNFDNLPVELTKQPRFFLVGADKVPLIKDWSNPSNQKFCNEIHGFAGFDCTGHGEGDDYLFLDFDHIFNADGDFINKTAEEFVSQILDALGGYCEKSISGTGLHMFVVPSVDYAIELPKMAGGAKASFYFTDERGKNCPKLEIFYRTKARYCLLTGNLYCCDKNSPITYGEKADEVIKNILAQIERQNARATATKTTPPSTVSKAENKKSDKNFDLKFFSDSDYDSARALKMIERIDVSKLSDSEWLAFMSACKNRNIDYSIVDAKNVQDSSRYNSQENFQRWQSLNDPSFDIETLHGLAKRFGYIEKDVYHEWHEDHSEKIVNLADDNRADGQANSNKKSNARQLSKEEKFALFSLPHTDLYNASRLSLFYGDKIRFLTDSHKWYTYHKNIWIDGGKENSAILPFARDLAFTISANVDEKDETDTEEKLAKMWQKRKTYANAIEILKGTDEILITEQDLNTHLNLLNCKNCVVDLETGKSYPHDSKLLMTQCINAEYRAGYRNERVDKFLSEILPDEETLQALLRFLGYCLTGDISEEKALFIHGRGGNGKSVTTKTLLNLFADYACGFPIESILTQPYTKDADAATPAFNKLQWRRLAVAEEIPAGRKLDYAKFKILTGGDALPIRKMYQEGTEIKNPVHKMIFSGNHLPELDDAHDAGILRRWLQIRFEQDFTKNPDTTLKKFLQTNDALSALLNILVENAVAWYKDGLLISEKMEKNKTAYFAANDFIAEFISEYCERNNSACVSRQEFLKRLKTEYPNETRGKSDQELTSVIVKVDGIRYKRGTGGRYKFFGVSFREGYQENLGDDFLPPDLK